eukprot:GILK01010891.1.p1 GENE.GILK01010891.1~~GILK01010891.1.p1  ORF type:complete len:865 (+),score=133.17 GILK01010891.1:88-2682(+)
MCKRINFPFLETVAHVAVPLKSISAEVDIQNVVTQITLTQVFCNNETIPIEAHFKFPIEDGVTVTGMSVRVGDRTIKGMVKDKIAAEDDYSDAIAAGDGVYLLKESEDSRTMVEMAVGNLAAGQEAIVSVTFVGEAAVQDHNWRLVLPVAIPARGRDSSTIPSPSVPASRHVLHKYADLPYTFAASVNMRMSSGISHLECPNFTTNMSVAEDRLSAVLQTQTPVVPAVHDFVLSWRTESMYDLAQSCIQKDPETQQLALAVNFVPNMPPLPLVNDTEGEPSAVPQNFEFTFIVDRSGSMRSGQRMQIAIDTLVLFLKSLPDNSIFNIISFGDSYRSLFPKAVRYSDDNVEQAVQAVQGFSADMGGTRIYEPLQSVFKSSLPKGYQRVLFALTDGGVEQTENVIRLVRESCSKQGARLFAFGLGSGASTELVNGIAEAGSGTAEYAVENERLQPKVIASLKRATNRCYDSWTVTWDPVLGVTDVPSPFKLQRALYDQEVLCVYAFIHPAPTVLRGTVRLQARKDNQEVELLVPIDLTNISEGLSVHKLAAKSVLEHMSQGTERTAFAVKHQLLCDSTAFVAVEHRDTPVTDTMETRTVPGASVGGRFVNAIYHMSRRPHPSPMHHAPSIASVRCSSGAIKRRTAGPALSCASAPPGSMRLGGMAMKKESKSVASPMRRPMMMAMTRPQSQMQQSSCPPPSASAAPIPMPAAVRCEADEESVCSISSSLDRRSSTESEESERSISAPLPSSVSPMKLFESLVQSQRTSGYWQLNNEFAQLLSTSMHTLEQHLQKLPQMLGEAMSADPSNMWATCLALAAFQTRLSSQQDEWELVAAKARKWLAKHISQDQINEAIANAELCLSSVN